MSDIKGSFLFNVYDIVIHNKKYVFDLLPSFQHGTLTLGISEENKKMSFVKLMSST